jgi:hypothetical protein
LNNHTPNNTQRLLSSDGSAITRTANYKQPFIIA